MSLVFISLNFKNVDVWKKIKNTFIFIERSRNTTVEKIFKLSYASKNICLKC